jgi:lysophospholipase L1-like esterase
MTIRAHLVGLSFAMVVAACGGGSGVTPSPSVVSVPTAASAQATAVAVASASAALPSELPSPSTVPPLRVVGLGDSYMSAQNAKGESFMDVYAAELEKELERQVDLTLITSGDSTSAKVRESLASDGSTRASVANADVIVISVGGNDSDPFGIYPKGTCAPSQPLPSCLKAYSPMLEGNYEAILASIGELRAGKPTAVRVTSMDDPFVGLPEAPSKTFARDFFAQVAEAQTEGVFAVAKKYNAKTVDYLHIFSGRDGLSDPARYLAADHGHPGDLGIEVIADELMRLGLPELD